MPTRKELETLVEDPEFRREFVGDFVQEMIATQIRAMRERLELTQEQLGEAASGMSQVQISRLENPDYSGVTVNSLKRVAKAFDVGLIVRLAPFSEFIDWIVKLTPDRLAPLSYAEELESQHLLAPVTSTQVASNPAAFRPYAMTDASSLIHAIRPADGEGYRIEEQLLARLRADTEGYPFEEQLLARLRADTEGYPFEPGEISARPTGLTEKSGFAKAA